MSKPKSTKKVVKKAAKKPRLAATALRTPPSARSSSAIDLLLSRSKPLSDDERGAFRSQFSDARCDAMGVRTKSANVLAEAKSWAVTIDKALDQYPRDLRRYGRTRFVWLLECVRDLAREIDAQRNAGGAGSAQASDLAARRSDALGARKDLTSTLEGLTEGDDAATEGVATATAIARDDDESLVRSVRALAALASDWLARAQHHVAARVLVASLGLDEADVNAATAKASALEEAMVARALGEKGSTFDRPSVNRIEGRVLLEMQRVMRVFEEAKKLNKLVPRLVPGSGVRSVMLRGRSSAATPPATAPALDGKIAENTSP